MTTTSYKCVHLQLSLDYNSVKFMLLDPSGNPRQITDEDKIHPLLKDHINKDYNTLEKVKNLLKNVYFIPEKYIEVYHGLGYELYVQDAITEINWLDISSKTDLDSSISSLSTSSSISQKPNIDEKHLKRKRFCTIL